MSLFELHEPGHSISAGAYFLNGLQAAPLLRHLALIGSVGIFTGLGGLPSLQSLCGLLVKLGERVASVFRPRLRHLIGSNP
jgi:hypothetical protein